MSDFDSARDNPSAKAGSPERLEHLREVRRIVIKVGSSLLADSPVGQPASIADEIAAIQSQRDLEIIVVSSGAIALGLPGLGLSSRPTGLPALQAAAAIGQNRLLQNWEHAFSAHGKTIAQVLVTHDDLSDRRRFLNARNAIRTLLKNGIIPIVNENDSVGTEEIKYGDNDQLAALVCNLAHADALFIYTDVNGLHDADPRSGGKRISLIRAQDQELTKGARSTSASGLGSGGMASKVQAAKNAARFGKPTLILPGKTRNVLQRALGGEDIGSIFIPHQDSIGSRKHWLAYGSKANGQIEVDDGAYQALREQGKSLLPVGLRAVHGPFDMGALVTISHPEHGPFAKGMVSYSSSDLEKICGCRSSEIEAKLGFKSLDEVVHRDDMVLL